MDVVRTLGGAISSAFGICERVEVVGTSSTAAGGEEAFLWTRESGMRSLGTLGTRPHAAGNDVNTHLRVVGNGFTREDFLLPFIWTPENGMKRLPTLGGPRGSPQRLTEFGQIVGTTETPTGELHATLWTPTAGPLLVAAEAGGSSREGR
jgi:probable HAF family extracellular repeat protein